MDTDNQQVTQAVQPVQPAQPGTEFIDEKTKHRIRVLKNGAWYDLDRSKIVRSQGVITSDNSHDFLRMRREKALKAVEQGIIEGSGKRSLPGGVQAMTAAQTRLALDIDKGRASTGAYRAVLQASGLLQAAHDASDNAQPDMTLSLSRDALMHLAETLLQTKRNSVAPALWMGDDSDDG